MSFMVTVKSTPAGVTLNYEKCVVSQNSVKFLGQIVDQNGIKPDPEKVNAIACMAELTNINEIRRFMGMVNQHSTFSSKLAELTKPLRDLLSKKNQWMWGQRQKDAFVSRALTDRRVVCTDRKRGSCGHLGM